MLSTLRGQDSFYIRDLVDPSHKASDYYNNIEEFMHDRGSRDLLQLIAIPWSKETWNTNPKAMNASCYYFYIYIYI
jgi:hypothetical protein